MNGAPDDPKAAAAPTAPGKLSKHQSLTRIRELGIEPKTIFDIGVASGTTGLYGVFPDVRYVMVEPLVESIPFMNALIEQYPRSIAVSAAAGPAPGKRNLIVAETLSGSSFLLKRSVGEVRKVRVVTVDDLVGHHRLEGPFLIKIDVQGYELEVLKGAEKTLAHTCAVITEASLWGDVKREGMTVLVDLMTWFDQRGFVLYDIAQIVRRKADDAITEMDLVFCPKDSPLRAASRYKDATEHAATVSERRRKFGL